MLFYSTPDILQAAMPPSFAGLDYSLDHHQQLMKQRIGETSEENNNGMIDYMLNNPQQHLSSSGFFTSNSLDRLSFADVMQFADFGPKLGLNQTKISEEETGIDPVYFLKFPVLNDKLVQLLRLYKSPINLICHLITLIYSVISAPFHLIHSQIKNKK